MKKANLCILLILILLLTACADPWFKADIVSDIDIYRPEMSSVPGMPLEIDFDISGPTPRITAITFITNNGGFIQWDTDGTVTDLGKSARLAGSKIYWTPYDENGGLVNSAKITVSVTYVDRLLEVGKVFTARISKNKDGSYILK